MDEIRAAAAGDTNALSALLMKHHESLLRFLERKLATKSPYAIDLEQVLQDTYITAFQRIRSFELRSEPAFYNWLRAIAESRLIDAKRMAGAQKRGGNAHRVSEQAGASALSYFN